MKYMLMMFGSAGEMMQTQSEDWVREMIRFMVKFDDDLRESGELVFAEGLADGSTAKVVSLDGGGAPVVTDGPYAEAKESLIGFWVLDVASEERAVEIAAQVAHYSGKVEMRQVGSPPEV